jgi:hypothetical protein
VQPQYRDGLLALTGVAGLVGLVGITGRLGVLVRPIGVGGGILAAVGLEILFVRYPSRAMAIWNRQPVPLLALCVLLVGAIVAFWFAPWLVAVPVWGLCTYLFLLSSVLLGIDNPVAVLFGTE